MSEITTIAAPTTTPKASANGKPKAKKAAKKPALKKMAKCLCGCGETTKSRFAPGHDARLKGRMLTAHRSDKGMSPKMKELVKELGWSKYITK